MAKGITKYQAHDGKLFDAINEAEAHEFALEALDKMANFQAKDGYQALKWLYLNMQKMGLQYLPSARE